MVPQVKNDRACVLCNDIITNPICMHCLENEMTSWAADFSEKLVENIRRNTKVFPYMGVTDVKCIICGKDMDVCPHCYSKSVMDLIKNPELKETFAETFNFDLREELRIYQPF